MTRILTRKPLKKEAHQPHVFTTRPHILLHLHRHHHLNLYYLIHMMCTEMCTEMHTDPPIQHIIDKTRVSAKTQCWAFIWVLNLINCEKNLKKERDFFQRFEENLVNYVNRLVNHRMEVFRREVLDVCMHQGRVYMEKTDNLNESAQRLAKLISKSFRIKLLDEDDVDNMGYWMPFLMTLGWFL